MENRKKELEALKRDDVRKIARECGVRNVSKYTKSQLIEMIVEHEENAKAQETEPEPKKGKEPCRVFYVKGNAAGVEPREKKGKEYYAEKLEKGDRIIYRKNGKLNSGKVRSISESNSSCVVINYDGFIESVSFGDVEFYCFNFVGGVKIPSQSIPKVLFLELKSRPESRREHKDYGEHKDTEGSKRGNQVQGRFDREKETAGKRDRGTVRIM